MGAPHVEVALRVRRPQAFTPHKIVAEIYHVVVIEVTRDLIDDKSRQRLGAFVARKNWNSKVLIVAARIEQVAERQRGPFGKLIIAD